jgi:hypothetical protein
MRSGDHAPQVSGHRLEGVSERFVVLEVSDVINGGGDPAHHVLTRRRLVRIIGG